MRTLLAAVFLLGLGGFLAAADDKLDEKFLIGKWAIKETGLKTTDNKVQKSIEFKPKGVYAMNDRGTMTEGKYKLKGTTLELTDKASGAVVAWKDLAIKDGKLTHPLGKKGAARAELTRVEEKPDEKK
ncbi:MAG: hypothetical protein J0I06_02795 [Planctomycetes bacterium]|nr:hypothetical protein [Planctomycetota bacterium]